MKYTHKDGTPFSKEEFLQKLKTDKEFNDEFGGKGIDQISNLIHDLKNDPDSRRLMVNAWNVSELEDMVLPPCHFGFQCYTHLMSEEERILEWSRSIDKHISYADKIDNEFLDNINFPKRKLDLKWFQRSVDSFLGLPFNIASYGILLHLIGKEVNMIPNKLIFNGGDCHIYTNHIDQCNKQMNSRTYNLPKLILKNKSIFDIKYEDIEIVDYISSPVIKAPLSN